MYIIVLSENEISSRFISNGLQYENIQCDSRAINDELINAYLLNNYDAIICKIPCDIEKADRLTKKLKEAGINVPLFLLIDSSVFIKKEELKVITKNIFPYNIPSRFLAYEIKQSIYKRERIPKEILKVHDLKLNLNTREVLRFGLKHALRNKEFHLLEYIMRNTDMLLSRQHLLENVWDRNAHLLTNTVDVHINCIRKKIDFKQNKRLIETVYCNGYILHSKPFCNY